MLPDFLIGFGRTVTEWPAAFGSTFGRLETDDLFYAVKAHRDVDIEEWDNLEATCTGLRGVVL